MPSLKAVSHTHVLLVSQGVLVIHVCEKLNNRQKTVVTLFVLATFILLFLLLPASSPFISLSIFSSLPAC